MNLIKEIFYYTTLIFWNTQNHELKGICECYECPINERKSKGNDDWDNKKGEKRILQSNKGNDDCVWDKYVEKTWIDKRGGKESEEGRGRQIYE